MYLENFYSNLHEQMPERPEDYHLLRHFYFDYSYMKEVLKDDYDLKF